MPRGCFSSRMRRSRNSRRTSAEDSACTFPTRRTARISPMTTRENRTAATRRPNGASSPVSTRSSVSSITSSPRWRSTWKAASRWPRASSRWNYVTTAGRRALSFDVDYTGFIISARRREVLLTGARPRALGCDPCRTKKRTLSSSVAELPGRSSRGFSPATDSVSSCSRRGRVIGVPVRCGEAAGKQGRDLPFHPRR